MRVERSEWWILTNLRTGYLLHYTTLELDKIDPHTTETLEDVARCLQSCKADMSASDFGFLEKCLGFNWIANVFAGSGIAGHTGVGF